MPYNYIRYGTYTLRRQVPTFCSLFSTTYALPLHQVTVLTLYNVRYLCVVALSVPMPYDFISYVMLMLYNFTLCSFYQCPCLTTSSGTVLTPYNFRYLRFVVLSGTYALPLHQVRYLRFTRSCSCAL
jgi:hypothetical protein